MTTGERIRCAREQANLTQEELGKLCGTTKQTIYKYETGIITNIPLDRIEAIAAALNVPAEQLTGWDKPYKRARIVDDMCKSWIKFAAERNMKAIECLENEEKTVSVIRDKYLQQFPFDDGENLPYRLLSDSALLRILLDCELEATSEISFFSRYGINPKTDKTTLLLVEQIFCMSQEEKKALLDSLKNTSATINPEE